MRDEGEIRQKLKQAQFRHLKRVLRSRFASKEDWPKDEVAEIKSEVKEFFQTAPLHEIAAKYPDVAALLWVLDARDSNPLVPGGTLVGRMDGVVLWADTESEADHARSAIDQLVASVSSVPPVSGPPPSDRDTTDPDPDPDPDWDDPPEFFAVPTEDLDHQPPSQEKGCKLSWWQRWFG